MWRWAGDAVADCRAVVGLVDDRRPVLVASRRIAGVRVTGRFVLVASRRIAGVRVDGGRSTIRLVGWLSIRLGALPGEFFSFPERSQSVLLHSLPLLFGQRHDDEMMKTIYVKNEVSDEFTARLMN